jgi:4-hydroxybenzoate polyprenyltransferase
LADLVSSGAGGNYSRTAVARHLLIHLRLHYQILLAPIFLWGYFLAVGEQGAQPDGKFWIGFLAFHLCFYGGTTAYNSYYDRDEGPVGGLAKPSPVDPALLPFSLILQVIGAGLAFTVNSLFLTFYLLDFILGTAYSHPAIRLKGKPLGSLWVIGLGQGVFAGLAGYVIAKPDLLGITALTWLGIIAVALITVGFYPLTQIYQIEEDLARGDLTFTAWAGPKNAFRFAIGVQSVAAALLVGVIWNLLGPWKALLVALFYISLLLAIAQWASVFDSERILANYRRVMRINMLTSLGFLGFIGLHLFGIL